MGRKPAASRIYRFTAPLEKMGGRFAWSYVEFPHDVEKLFGKKGNVRVKGTMNGVPVDRALMPTKSGYHLIILGADIRRAANIKKEGQLVEVEIWLNTDPTKLDIPEELSDTMDFIPEMKAAWNKLTPGMQRSMCYWVNSGKAVETRAKRVAELLRRFETGHFQVGKAPEGKG